MATIKVETRTQQEFLLDAMAQLGMDEDRFAERIGTTRKVLDGWMLPPNDKKFVSMPDVAWKFIGEILERHANR